SLILWEIPLGPILFSLFPAGSSVAQSVFQAQTAASGIVGQTLTLTCTYSTSKSSYNLFWYRQPPTGEMIYLLGQYSEDQNARTGRFSVSFLKAENSINLTITALEPGDSAVYFCTWGINLLREQLKV
uniref:Ig-like domain-containing protein n=1 Tax=Ornithorhynchus anatinus TaxID=9258 RepID=A0A6I8N521_ORNAN